MNKSDKKKLENRRVAVRKTLEELYEEFKELRRSAPGVNVVISRSVKAGLELGQKLASEESDSEQWTPPPLNLIKDKK